MKIKNKILNHLTKNGKKNTTENIFLNSVKNIQKKSKKQFKKIIQTAIINATPIFRMNKFVIKKKKKKKIYEIPSFINDNNKRISLGIKFIVAAAKKKSGNLSFKLGEEILSNLSNNSSSIKTKKDLQKKALKNKNYFLYYKW